MNLYEDTVYNGLLAVFWGLREEVLAWLEDNPEIAYGGYQVFDMRAGRDKTVIEYISAA